jgi:hypothetical protein
MAASWLGYDEARDRYPDLRDKEQIITKPGERAVIRVEALPGKTFHGRVKTVATVPSQADWFSADVKVYQTMVTIEDIDPRHDKLKPGMSAAVTITADEIREPVLQIPIQSVVGYIADGAERKCYVLDSSGVPQLRDIKLGKSNDIMVQVLSGLEEKEIVVLAPGALLPANSGMKAATPSGRKGMDSDDASKKGKKGDGPPGKGGAPNRDS